MHLLKKKSKNYYKGGSPSYYRVRTFFLQPQCRYKSRKIFIARCEKHYRVRHNNIKCKIFRLTVPMNQRIVNRVVQHLRVSGQFFFSYQDILNKYKTRKYLNTPKTHNKAQSLGKKCPDKISDKKIINNFLFNNKM